MPSHPPPDGVRDEGQEQACEAVGHEASRRDNLLRPVEGGSREGRLRVRLAPAGGAQDLPPLRPGQAVPGAPPAVAHGLGAWCSRRHRAAGSPVPARHG
ncbi:MAG: hypothetical protein M3P93_15595, partial [Actinomycetota bacterium]|nr:hypothetical protein [Actinomycetota bacterium]